MKSAGLIARFLQFFGTMFAGWKLGNQARKSKDLKDKVEANEIEDELEGNSADDDVADLSRLRDKQ